MYLYSHLIMKCGLNHNQNNNMMYKSTAVLTHTEILCKEEKTGAQV